VRENFVAIHVEARSGAHVEDVNRKLIPILTAKNLVCCLNDCFADIAVKQSQISIRLSTSLLEKDVGVDHLRVLSEPADLEEVTASLGLRAPIGIRRNLHFAQAVLLDSVVH